MATFKDLLGMSGDELAKLDNKQLLAYFPSDIFNIVRPDPNYTPKKLQAKDEETNITTQKKPYINRTSQRKELLDKAANLAKQFGLEL